MTSILLKKDSAPFFGNEWCNVSGHTSQSRINGFAELLVGRASSDKHGGRDVKAPGKGANLSDVQLSLAAQDFGNNPL